MECYLHYLIYKILHYMRPQDLLSCQYNSLNATFSKGGQNETMDDFLLTFSIMHNTYLS